MSIDANQVLTVTIPNLPTFTLLLLGILYNNARLNDVRDLLRAEFKSEIFGVRSEIRALRSELHAEIRDVRTIMEKNHSDLLRILPIMTTASAGWKTRSSFPTVPNI